MVDAGRIVTAGGIASGMEMGFHLLRRAGYDEAFIKSYLASQANSYNHPNAAIEPRIPGIFQYYSVAEDELAKIYAGQATAQAGADAIAAAWEKITDQIGRDNQIKLYKASLG